ncbi:type II toxin-antitoxin system RelE/ParE family toxin [Methylobacterium sp. Leaf456]|uniref:type II toxin-antitoxin system RelE family toxin n=1 Tax=Methylobacterium sp. Leaf456 TaxID=1736382 RepID=UPI000A94BDEA|nr:type II toxin-antitoxin system RelE/ParE family toxin [Methylobacterium sp. Leaf456]
MGRSVVFTRAAARSFSRMPRNTEELIRGKLRQLAEDPAALANNVKALKGGEERYRLRIGDWRAVFTLEADRIIVHDIGPRGSIYG